MKSSSDRDDKHDMVMLSPSSFREFKTMSIVSMICLVRLE